MKLENLERLLEGKWENKNKYSHYKLDGEKITFYALEETYDYIIVSNMYQFRDFLKESLKNKTYKKENEKYLRKFLKVCELWLIDYFSRTTYNIDTDGLYSEYINEYPTRHSFEISFDEGLPVNALLEGKLLRLDFQITPTEGSSVNKLNYTQLDLSKTGESVELQADSAVLVYNGVSYALGENESLYTQPLQFEVYETLSKEDKDESIGQIYLKLSDESANMIKDLPTKLDIDASNLEELGDDTLSVQNGVVVKYSLEIPYDVFQAGSKVNKSVK